MKQLNTLLCLIALLIAGKAMAQPASYGDEWIDYSKTYYKFKTGTEGVFRITKAALDAAGLAPTAGTGYILYRDGREVTIYVSNNGQFGNGDYIEFYAPHASGRLDAELYANPAWQVNEKRSLFTDSATYFLTVDNSTTHFRYANVPNNIPGNPTAVNSCYTISDLHFNRTFAAGRHIVDGQPIFASLFEQGEGFVDTFLYSGAPQNYTLNTPNAVGGQNAQLKLVAARNNYQTSPLAIPVKLYLNGQQVADSSMTTDATKKFNLTVSSSLLTATNTVQFAPTTNSTTYDVSGVAWVELRYPRNFDVSGLQYFRFELTPSSTQQYLEFQNFNHGGTAPRLYDVTNSKWYSGDISQTGKTRYYIDASFDGRELILVAAANTSNLSFVKTIQFTDYAANTAAQGDYVIITHKGYTAITNGRNYVQDYAAYRQSAAGGSRDVTMADVTDLYDQFAYGVEMHPLAIKHFLQAAYYKWTVKPHDVFLIGKGIYYPLYRKYLQSPNSYNFTAVLPTYGEPGADVDFVNFLPSQHQAMNIGRLSAWNPQEIGTYLDKAKAYEANINSAAVPNASNDLWKKRVLHIVGGRNAAEQAGFLTTLNNGGSVLADTAFGAMVTIVAKNTTVPTSMIESQMVDSLINSGLSFVSYHGHASATGFEFNLNSPELYNSTPKFPHFLALGCDVAQIFATNVNKTVSEKFLAASTGGSISMIASDNLQYANFHAKYLPGFYKSVSQRNYGKTIGDHHHFIYDSLRTTDNSDFTFFHLESMLLQGDPALVVPGEAKPDYHVNNTGLTTMPVNVTTQLDSFKLNIVAFNLGRAITDTVRLKITHTNPANAIATVNILSLLNLYNTDTVSLSIPINKTEDLGLNKYTVTIDDGDEFDEVSESNNVAVLELFIYSDNLVPVYPQEFSIVSTQGITLKASTLNAFRPTGIYRLEIDTTELFNSSVKQATTISSAGGVIKWTPTIAYQNNTVYYWRTTFDSVQNGGYQWSGSSFIYLAGSAPGWNQSHYYQYLKDKTDSLTYGTDRKFAFPTSITKVKAINSVFSENGSTPWNTADYVRVLVNGSDAQRAGCPPFGGTLQVMVFDSASNAVWRNSFAGTAGAYGQCNTTRNVYAFEFPVYTKQGRDDASRFIRDSIPNGNFVLVRNFINDLAYTPSYAADWKADTLINGTGQSLYHVLYNMGFTLIDSFNSQKAFIFLRKKGSTAYPVHQFIGVDKQEKLEKEFDLPKTRSDGKLISTIIGPASKWNTLKWQTSALDNLAQNDIPIVTVYGIDSNGVETVLFTDRSKDTSLAFINKNIYPRIRLSWKSQDTINYSSAQLDYWRVLFEPVPEAALNPALHFAYTEDTVEVGKTIDFSTAIENLTALPMDSMLVRYKIIDASGVSHTIGNVRYKGLTGNDTLHASFKIDPSDYAGNNLLFIEANPDNDQPEQYHPNNLGYLPLYVESDERNPLIDVTFDGVHILNKDIVSAKPFIKISLKDENKYLALDDTSLLKVSIRYPGDAPSNRRAISFDGTVCRFIPATTGDKKNEAFIEYRPTFLEDGVYELYVNGRDKAGNEAGATDYQISFEVINKSTITHVLNYPNPFSTSTAFLFTLTGSVLPSQFKIQILSVTGRVVREITRQELGPIHVGRNITEYKWDGRDQYGQVLGNGVYLYRIVTAINGEGIEHRSDMDGNADVNNVDKFFKNGWGKMYIMR